MEIPILPDAMAALLAIPEDRRKGPVLPEVAACYRRNHVYPCKEASRIFRQAKVFNTDAGRASFHSYRTTWQTLNDAAGTSRVIARAVLGHTGAAISDTYSRTDAERARKAVGKAIPRL